MLLYNVCLGLKSTKYYVRKKDIHKFYVCNPYEKIHVDNANYLITVLNKFNSLKWTYNGLQPNYLYFTSVGNNLVKLTEATKRDFVNL